MGRSEPLFALVDWLADLAGPAYQAAGPVVLTDLAQTARLVADPVEMIDFARVAIVVLNSAAAVGCLGLESHFVVGCR